MCVALQVPSVVPPTPVSRIGLLPYESTDTLRLRCQPLRRWLACSALTDTAGVEADVGMPNPAPRGVDHEATAEP